MEGETNKFTVMPMAQEVSLDPGTVYEGSISVVNPAEAENDFEYEVTVTPYNVIGLNNSADLLTQTNYSMIKNWISIDKPTGKVQPNSISKVDFKITVPADAPGGGQYATITVQKKQGDSQKEGVNVENAFGLASVLYAKVSGEIRHEGKILENKIPSFSINNPITVTALFSNSGNVHEEATIIIKATNTFTGEVILPKSDNEARYTEIVMPGTEKEVSREVNDLPAVGVVQVEQTIHFMGETSTETVNVVMCPVWFMVLSGVTLALFILLIVKLVKRSRKKKAALNAA